MGERSRKTTKPARDDVIDDIRAQPLLALHEFIEELIVVVKKLIVPATEVQLHEGVM